MQMLLFLLALSQEELIVETAVSVKEEESTKSVENTGGQGTFHLNP